MNEEEIIAGENLPPEGEDSSLPTNEVIEPQPENMEVHHHPHLEHKPKVWKEYFLEFLMIFLAVTLGFFAENLRENFVEHERERQFVVSIAEDIRSDIHQLDSIITTRRNMSQLMDSLLYLLNYTDARQHGNEIYYYSRWVPRTYRFYTNDRTILQLKNAGNWRLIRKPRVSESLANYDNLVRTIAVYIEQREESLVLIMYQSINKLFDNKVFDLMVDGLNFNRPTDNPQLTTYDRNTINEFCNQVHFRQNANLYFTKTAERLLKEAQKTLNIIEEEYDLK